MSTTPRGLPSTSPSATAESSSGFSSSSSYPPAAAAVAPPAQQHPACSACKHQRRKCAPGCPLAPYFPADKPGSFRNSHRLFGIKNILRFLTRAGLEKRDDCMKSILYEADARAANPVLGSYGVFQELRKDCTLAEAELSALQEELKKHRPVPDGQRFLSPVQSWMPPQPLLYIIPEEHQHPFYRCYIPPGAVKIDDDATVGVKVDEDEDDAGMSMQHDDPQGCTLVGAPYAPSSSSYQPSDASPRVNNRRALGLKSNPG